MWKKWKKWKEVIKTKKNGKRCELKWKYERQINKERRGQRMWEEEKKYMVQILTKYERKWKLEKRTMDFWTLIWIANVYIDNSKILMFKELRTCWDETWKERFSLPNQQVVTFHWPSFSHSYITPILHFYGWGLGNNLHTTYKLFWM
jgi:hypothetical protein